MNPKQNLKRTIKKIIAQPYYNLYRRYKNHIGNRVLLYHSIGSKLTHDTYGISISKTRFIEHIRYLNDNHEIIAIDDDYKNNLEKKSISITFDDGYKDNLIALELCEKYNTPFTLYITTGEIGNKDYLNEDEIKEFANSDKCILGTHSVTHPHLATLNYNEQCKELRDSKKRLQDIISKEVLDMSYPHGSYNSDTLKIIDELGYKAASSCHIGLNTKDNIDMKLIKRIDIIASDDIQSLNQKICGYYDYLLNT